MGTLSNTIRQVLVSAERLLINTIRLITMPLWLPLRLFNKPRRRRKVARKKYQSLGISNMRNDITVLWNKIKEVDNQVALVFNKADMIGKMTGNSEIVEKVKVLDLAVHQIDDDCNKRLDTFTKAFSGWEDSHLLHRIETLETKKVNVSTLEGFFTTMNRLDDKIKALEKNVDVPQGEVQRSHNARVIDNCNKISALEKRLDKIEHKLNELLLNSESNITDELPDFICTSDRKAYKPKKTLKFEPVDEDV